METMSPEGDMGGTEVTGEEQGELGPLSMPPLAFCSFLYFMRRFWNHILICRSERLRCAAISILLGRQR